MRDNSEQRKLSAAIGSLDGDRQQSWFLFNSVLRTGSAGHASGEEGIPLNP
jgi:hypothetical protein